MSKKRTRCPLLVALLAVGLIGCSPEAQRTRGGGPGADPGNVDSVVEIHRGADPGYKVPLTGAGRDDNIRSDASREDVSR
ncbi:MAG: hypothetical protein M3Q29_20190 [Chloroflexota bacterium]|nr:hypothetical protein [Chloroflexota bacterium]